MKAHCRERRGAAAVEFAVFALPLFILLIGLWEVGRITEVEGVMWNSAREAARDASLGDSDLPTVAANLLTYLQAAEPTAFGANHTTTMISPVITLPANAVGYTCWDTTANRELFTMSFVDATDTSVTDPTAMAQLDRSEIVVSVPYASIGWLRSAKVTGASRLTATVDWVSMVDAPFSIPPVLPAQ
jgi:Flp pilus assembly protein TadG